MAMRCPRCKTPVRLVYVQGKLLWLELTPSVGGRWVMDGMVMRPFSPTTDDPDLPRYAEHRSQCPGVSASKPLAV